MVDFVPSEKATTIRVPSTANFLIDSADATSAASISDILISPSKSLLNGFFSRIGTTEIVLEWREPNVSSALNNINFTLEVQSAPTQSLILNQGFYTAQSALQAVVKAMNDVSGATGATFTLTNPAPGFATITSSSPLFRLSGVVPTLLGISNGLFAAFFTTNGSAIDLRPYRYLDFVSAQLTYNQDLKDATSSENFSRDVLARWYFAWDEAPQLDGFGMPILMGYTPFCARRAYSVPKQIKWDARQPIGQISIQIYGSSGFAPANLEYSQYEMTLQVSEV